MYLPILTYHRILTGPSTRANDPSRIGVSRDQFRQHLQWLRRLGYRTLDLTRYPALLRSGEPLARRTVAITFDDGYVDVLQNGLPLLKEFGFTATLFAVSGQMPGTNRWDEGSEPLMSADDYKTWISAGMQVGSHGRSHAHLTAAADAAIDHELAGSKKDLENALGIPITLFAYPYGEWSLSLARRVEAAGYEAAFACDRAPRDHAENPFALRRPVVFPKNNTFNIWMKCQRWYPLYQDLKRKS